MYNNSNIIFLSIAMPRQTLHSTTTKSSKTNDQQNIILGDINGKDVTLTASHIEKWFAQAESALSKDKHELTPSSTAKLSTQFLKRFGLQSGLHTPQHVIDFLKSPAGKITTALIEKQLAEMAATEGHVKQEMLKEQIIKIQRLSFLLMGMLHKRKLRERQLNEEVQLAKDRRRREEETAAIQKRLAGTSSTQLILDPNLEMDIPAYEQASEAIEQLLDSRLLESELLEEALAKLEKLTLLTTKKYAHYNTVLNTAYQEITELMMTPTLSIVNAQQKIATLTSEIDLDTNEISMLLEQGRDDDAREKMEFSNARNLYIAMLVDMVSVIEGHKFMYTQNGKKTTNFHEAEYIVAKQNRLIFSDGKYYLVETSKTAEDLTIEDKITGEAAFLRLRPEIVGVKQLVMKNQQAEQSEHVNTKAKLLTRSEVLQQEILFLANQLTQIQATRADMAIPLNSTTPTPSMRQEPRLTPNTSHDRGLSGSYSHMLVSMRPTKQQIDWLKTEVEHTAKPKLKTAVNKLSPGAPIPQAVLQQLLTNRYLGRLWLNPNLPKIDKTDLGPNATTPTPYSTRPKPIRGVQ